tara:strand:- start:313 stop:774 length:462 start_codon:yes stop_codon:yes gene_type:complete
MKLDPSDWYAIWLVIAMLLSYSLLCIFPIASFPTSYSKSVHAFQLPKEHALITYPEYYEYVWVTAALFPVMAMALASVQHAVVNGYVIMAVSYMTFIIVYPQAFSFGTDAKPLNFDTRPSWSVYMAVYLPLFALIGVDGHKLIRHKSQTVLEV